jgi:hypothetical protein
VRPEGRRSQGDLRGERGHDLRRAEAPAGEGVDRPGLVPAVALRHLEEGRARLPGVLPAVRGPRLHGVRAGQRLRPPPGSPRRGGGRRDLRVDDARGQGAEDLRRRQPDPRLRVHRRRRARVRAGDRPGVRQAGEHRHRARDQRERFVQAARDDHRVRRGAGSRSTSPSPRRRSRGSPGPTSRTASPRRWRT